MRAVKIGTNSIFLRRASIFLPSVSFLIHKNSIPVEALQLIKPSGPKNRISKGDVLNYLKHGHEDTLVSSNMIDNLEDDSHLDSVLNESWHYIDLNLRKARGLNLDLSNSLLKASLQCISKLGTADLYLDAVKSSSILFTRESSLSGSMSSIIDIKKPLQSLKIENRQGKTGPGVFRYSDTKSSIVDSLRLGDSESKDRILSNGELGILSFDPKPNHFQTDDILDSLSGYQPIKLAQTESENPESVVQKIDLIESLSLSDALPAEVRVELLVDARAITPKVASTFLHSLKYSIENKPEDL